MSSIDERFEFACELIREAGAKALGYFRNFESLEVKSKGVQDMASEADVETEKLIERAVTSRYGDSYTATSLLSWRRTSLVAAASCP